MNPLLLRLRAAGYIPSAYVDDFGVGIQARSRMDLEAKAAEVTRIVIGWCQDKKLTLNFEKSKLILLKGKMDSFPPRVKIGDIVVKPSREVKFLGVLLGERCSFGAHLQELRSRIIHRFSCLNSIAGTTWGLRYRCRETLYKAAFLPVALYAAPAWGQALRHAELKLLEQAQRRALLLVTGAYRTAPTAALQVIVGQPPIDLQMQKAIAKYKIKRGMPASVVDCGFVCPGGRFDDVAGSIDEVILTEWQRRWDTSEAGRLTHEFFPDVRKRIRNDWIETDFWTVQLLTGHGDINSKLHFFHRKGNPNCSCGALEDVRHILFDCPLYTRPRLDLAGEYSLLEWPPQSMDRLVATPDIFRAFKKFARAVFQIKKRMAQDG